MVQSSCSVKNGKLNETIEVSALWSTLLDYRYDSEDVIRFRGPS